MPPARVLAVGDAIVDVVTAPLPALRARDVQLEVPEHAVVPGGNATNFALGAAALGSSVAFVGSIGADPFAEVVRGAFLEAGVSARLRVDRRRPTGMTVAVTWSRGGRSLITAVGANAGLRETDVPAPWVARAEHVHRAGFWWTPGFRGAPTARLLARARRAGATTSLDVSTDPQGWAPSRVATVRRCLPHVTTFLGNAVEIQAIAGIARTSDAARELCRLGAEETVVHRGGNGSMYITQDEALSSPAFRVRVDNPTGCGDVFNAGFVHARLSGLDVREALAFANACGAIHLRDRKHPYPSAAAVRRFLRRHRRRP